MKREGGPTINNFVHTETQDGKSLLDAHFAHATAIVKRYLRRVRNNRLNKVTSPSELVDAISSRGDCRTVESNSSALMTTLPKS